jgi:hypothetical protein
VTPRRIAFLVAALALAGCGGRTSTPAPLTSTAAPAPTPTTTSAPAGAVRVYFLRRGSVAPVLRRTTAATDAVARAAIEQLLAGPRPSEHLVTAIPPETTLVRLTLGDGLASVRLSHHLPRAAQAQVVYTLTQFPHVAAVSVDGGPGRDRSFFEDETPQILVESPLPGETVTTPLRLQGTANTFEATFQVDVLDGAGHTLASDFVTATSGSGQRGTFDKTLDVDGPAGPITLVAYEVSAADGSRLHEVEIPLTLR